MKTSIKFLIAIVFDITDFVIGRIPIFGTLFDIAGTISLTNSGTS